MRPAAAIFCAFTIGGIAADVVGADSAGAPAIQQGVAPSRPQATGRAAAEAPRPAPKISVSRATPESGPSPALRAAYDALQRRDYETAARLYDHLARTDQRNPDVLLGQAAIALHRGDVDAARNHYVAVLRLEPANTTAQGTLLALFGRADYATAEMRLKELASRDPSAFLYQALGTLYAEQGLWPQAQHAYYQAHRVDAHNADHAYNLAVSLEHIGQREPAATYYRRAVELARTRPTTAFDVAHAQSRAARLAGAGND